MRIPTLLLLNSILQPRAVAHRRQPGRAPRCTVVGNAHHNSGKNSHGLTHVALARWANSTVRSELRAVLMAKPLDTRPRRKSSRPRKSHRPTPGCAAAESPALPRAPDEP